MKACFIENIEQSIINNWDKESLSDYQGDTFCYRDVARRIAKLHITMDELGIQKGDKIAIYGRNSANWVIVFFSILTHGCVVVPIQNEFRAEQVHNIVNHSEARFLFVGDGIAPNLNFDEMPNLLGIAHLADLTVRHSRNEKLLYVREHLAELFDKKYPNGLQKEDIVYRHEESPEEMGLLNYTSGTTGFSKGVMIPYRSLWGNLDFTQTVLSKGINVGDNLVSTLPAAHTFGMTCEILFGFVYGMHIHFLNRPTSPSIILKMCKAVHPSILVTVPLIIEKIIHKTIFPRLQRSNLRYYLKVPFFNCFAKKRIVEWLNEELGGNIYEVFTGGASMNLEIEKFLMKIGFPITSGYGCTETSPMITYSDYTDHALGSCGTVVPHMEMKILNNNPYNDSGEVLCKGMNVMLGYYKNPEETAKVLEKDGWLHTGDLGKISEDGHLFLHGRLKNILLGSNGMNIYPEEIEDKLNSLPMVSESLVVQDGSRLVALVYPDKEAVNDISLSVNDIRAVMEENRNKLNAMLPVYCKISEIRLHNKEFEKTTKKSIKRYLYAITH